MIANIALALSIAAFAMSFVAWVILRKLCSALSELATEAMELVEQVEAATNRKRDDLLKRAKLTPVRKHDLAGDYFPR